MLTNRLLIGLALALAILLAIAVYRSRWTGERMRVTPDAAEEIDKAKRR